MGAMDAAGSEPDFYDGCRAGTGIRHKIPADAPQESSQLFFHDIFPGIWYKIIIGHK